MDIEDIEVQLFVRAMQLRHGYDFSEYAPASLKRRVQQLVRTHGVASISELNSRLLHEDGFVARVIEGLSVPVSEMFRDPPVFRALRDKVFPVLASYPEINIWQAGCAHGQEVYSLAILLEEAGLYERSRIYATDFNDAALAIAADGIYATREARDWSRNYMEAGGSHSLSDYYSARYDFIKLDQRLRRNVTFFNHNLVTDEVFCEAHLILCRNVLIYFSNPLQDRTLGLFRNSLVRGGFLCLGTRENIDFSPAGAGFTDVEHALRIYQVGGTGARALSR
ncbi:chemotaxis protein CheR [Luteibacter rhizovicinus DSM 16549]|uniref:Chemotaxis protein CheR n=1 Tax=Luteibacter rhizovicinus DSM 16549 TaxID=1440763 RepID=A0A0G9HFS7_9GAMM|nr:CheR family methyltransferase [Luteibacter rhizovicinus]APG02908.1 chemotaxis protein CheR [Luteibacter rhizovicinus DSM 16549]KLD68578.1 chemotaxis protein CheR [Luteibacter rhizovicinus DSM 16549]KLD76074.1 chemotaxis protein CheR [Xanthomonas hyacinthi DSM 19077]